MTQKVYEEGNKVLGSRAGHKFQNNCRYYNDLSSLISNTVLELGSRVNVYHFHLPSSPILGNPKVGEMLQKL